MKRYHYLKNVVTLALDEDKCIECGMCLLVCPHGVLQMTNGQVGIADRDACKECGACAMNCPAEAVTVCDGVGCATAVINSMLGRGSSSCCCTIDPPKTGSDPSGTAPVKIHGTGCC